jgi:FixJ family two-component response regulator
MTPRPLIAIVDDDASVRQALKRLIQSIGFIVATFPNTNEFLQSAAFQEAKCLILDIQMPGLDGIGLLSVMQALRSPIATIVITAHPDAQARACARGANVLGLLEKPFDDQALIDLIEKVCPAPTNPAR